MRRFVLGISLLAAMTPLALAEWQPPIGIPNPPFGITTTHTRYADCGNYKYNYGNGETCYLVGANGPYTHYVDPAHPNATDANNPRGTESIPRVTLPPDFGALSAGSVVEIHGDSFRTSSYVLAGNGTADRPIFIRGIPATPATFTVADGRSNILQVRGSHYVIENLKFDLNNQGKQAIRFGLVNGPVDSISIRNCEFFNSSPAGNPVVRLIHEHNNANQITNIVFFNNSFHDLGLWRTELVKGDTTAISIDQNVAHVWIVENKFFRIGGDGVQIATDTPDASAIIPNHIYIGRNEIYDNFENAVDLKICEDVIISENIAHSFGPLWCTNCDPNAQPFRYGSGEGNPGDRRNNIWTLFNFVYNSSGPDGVFMSYAGDSENFPTDIYYIGNIAYNIHSAEGTATAFGSWNQRQIHWVNNTAYNVDRAATFFGDRFNNTPDEKLTLQNNIFAFTHSDATSAYGVAIAGSSESLARAKVSNNLFFRAPNAAPNLSVGVYNASGKVSWAIYPLEGFARTWPSLATASIGANPMLANPAAGNFGLLAASPAVDGGTTVSYAEIFFASYGIHLNAGPNSPLNAYDGNSDGQAQPDIGAIEYRPAVTLPAPWGLRVTPR